MDEQLNNLLENLFESLDKYLKEYIMLVVRLQSDKEIMSFIEKFKFYINEQGFDYPEEFKSLKKQIFQDERYKKYSKYENELLYLSFEMSDKLKSIIKEDSIESN